jgi:hypothetical protein
MFGHSLNPSPALRAPGLRVSVAKLARLTTEARGHRKNQGGFPEAAASGASAPAFEIDEQEDYDGNER